MDNNFKHLSWTEINKIYGLLGKKSFKQIAKELDRSQSTISREVTNLMKIIKKAIHNQKRIEKCIFRD